MARAPRFRISRLAELHRQVGFASEDAKRRQLRSAEMLLEEIAPDQAYPARDVEHRITGFRPSLPGASEAGADEMLVGEALLADLATFALRLSEEVPLAAGDRPGGAAPLEAIAARRGISVRTLQRWRGLGLAQHWIDFDGARRVGCFQAALDSFIARRPDALGRRSARRLRADERQRIVEMARAERRRTGGSLSAVAAAVAPRCGRAHETVRRLLERHDAAAAEPIFAGSAVDRGPLDERDRRLIERAHGRGVPLAAVAQRLGRSIPAIHRQLLVRRRERLVELRLAWVELPTFALPDAERVILGAPASSRGLRRLAGSEDVLALLAMVRSAKGRPTEAPGTETVPARPRRGRRPEAPGDPRVDLLIGAWNLLKRRAAGAIEALPQVPRAAALDEIERDLRWAALVQQSLVAEALPEAVRRADAALGRRIERLPAAAIRTVVAALVEVCAAVIERIDPSRGVHLDRLVAMDADLALARRPEAAVAGVAGAGPRRRADARHDGGSVTIDDPFARLARWQLWLDPPAGWPDRLATLPELRRRALTLLYGLDGSAPRTPREIARVLRVAPAAAARLAGGWSPDHRS